MSVAVSSSDYGNQDRRINEAGIGIMKMRSILESL